MPRVTNIQQWGGTAAQWAAANPVLAAREIGLELDTLKLKIGNGTAAWSALPYAVPGGTGLNTIDQSGAWYTWRKALANQANETARMLHIGDSITEGTGVSSHTQTWPYLVAQKIRQAYPSIAGNAVTGSTGWTPVRQTSSTLGSLWTIAGSYTDNLFGFRFTRSIALQPGGTVTGTVTGTSIDIWFPKGTATGTFTVKVDGVQVGGTYGGTNASTQDGFKQRVSLGAAGSHTVVLTSTHATNPQYFSGITVFNGNENSGVVAVNAGFHGSNTANWLTAANNANWVQNIPALDPHLVTIELGANDYSAALGYTAFKSNLRTLVEQIRANCITYPSIVFVAVHKRSETVTPRWEAYEYGLQQLATELGCGFIDCRRTMPDVGSAEAVSAGLYVDTVHPSAAGYALMADEIARVLLDPTTGILMEAPNPAPVGHTHAVADATSSGFMSAADKVKLDNTASGLVPSTIVTRDANSNFSAGMPSVAAHVATKAYVDGALGGATNGGVIIGTDGRLYRAIACVVRNTGSGFEFISDAGHAPVGVSSISTAADQLSFTINYSFTAAKVSSLVGTPDETLARLGYTMGASVGLSSATFSVSQPGGWGDYLSWNGSAWVSYNGFITSASMNGTTGLVTANHDDVNGTILGAQVSSRSFTYRATTDSMSGTSSSFYLVNNSGVALKTPNTTDCKVWISRDGARRVKMSELTYANSNIWIFGMMEI
jgi:lysophospholipase L1-like esterase